MKILYDIVKNVTNSVATFSFLGSLLELNGFKLSLFSIKKNTAMT